MDTIDSHTNFIVAAPVEPTDKALTQKLSRCVADIEDVREAHLPAVIEFDGQSQARLTLFIVVRQHIDKEHIAALLRHNLSTRLSGNSGIDIKVIADDYPLLESIRATGCVVGWRD